MSRLKYLTEGTVWQHTFKPSIWRGRVDFIKHTKPPANLTDVTLHVTYTLATDAMHDVQAYNVLPNGIVYSYHEEIDTDNPADGDFFWIDVSLDDISIAKLQAGKPKWLSSIEPRYSKMQM